MAYEIQCPFCSHKNNIEGEDLPWEEDGETTWECRDCEKDFLIVVHITVRHEGIDPNER